MPAVDAQPCCWTTYALCSAIYLISSDKQNDDTGYQSEQWLYGCVTPRRCCAYWR
ncbi:hypothetical protein KCP76_20510 [Salmonella enterica subsp. enterica serovar Weltevreden]|nr:hypothetical protein KCP76_20510 [Salmonella enterica subsp. enterica serovar Weltevreden]